MDRYYKAREIVCGLLKKDLFGYIDQNEIIVDTLPDNYYVIGRLFPQKREVSQEGQEVSGTEDGYDTGEQPVSLYQAFMPSSMAISFTVDCEIEQLQVDYEFAWYEPHLVKVDDKHSVLQWHRNSKHGEEVIPLGTSFKPLPIHDGLELQMFLQKAYDDGVSARIKSLCPTHNKWPNRINNSCILEMVS